jgi:hypothetical protein
MPACENAKTLGLPAIAVSAYPYKSDIGRRAVSATVRTAGNIDS